MGRWGARPAVKAPSCPFCSGTDVDSRDIEHRCRAYFRASPDGHVEILPRSDSYARTHRRRYDDGYDFTFARVRTPGGVLWRRCLHINIQERKSRRLCVLCGHSHRNHFSGVYVRGENIGLTCELALEVRCRVKSGDGRVCTCPRFKSEDADLSPNVPRKHYLPSELNVKRRENR